jgi:glucosamine--fructose-6-phosphate aminotransferase (isomerizing)
MSIIKIKFVSTIDAFENEIVMQLEFLEHFEPSKPLSNVQQNKAIFCGAGDSFAASLLGEVFSDFKAKALDPLDLSKHQRLPGKHFYLVSISGNTISNIKLAKKARHATAITANQNSRLAKVCKDLIHLKFHSTGMQTAASVSFLASALTCISLVTAFKVPKYLDLYKLASKVAKIQIHGRIHFLGNLYSFPIAMFCAAKLSEVMGADAHYERIEQFSHMGLFSSRKNDTVIIFEKRNDHNEIGRAHV